MLTASAFSLRGDRAFARSIHHIQRFGIGSPSNCQSKYVLGKRESRSSNDYSNLLFLNGMKT